MSESIRAVERALDVLLCFSQGEPVLSLTQIADRLDMPKSTIHRYLATLEAARFVRRDEATGSYHLGYCFIEMASLVLQEADLVRWFQPHLERLSSECGETVDLAVLDDAQVIYLQVIESPHRVKIAAAVGQRLPAFCTASGKAFLAYMPDEQVHHILSQGMPRYTDCTRVSFADLQQDLRVTRERGFATSEQEYERDINAVAAPILDANGCPVAVIAIAGPAYRLSRERMLELGLSILAATEAIAREVGSMGLTAIAAKTGISRHCRKD
jgi:DNA-binding IclR family transcriptional regulator